MWQWLHSESVSLDPTHNQKPWASHGKIPKSTSQYPPTSLLWDGVCALVGIWFHSKFSDARGAIIYSCNFQELDEISLFQNASPLINVSRTETTGKEGWRRRMGCGFQEVMGSAGQGVSEAPPGAADTLRSSFSQSFLMESTMLLPLILTGNSAPSAPTQ